MNENSQVLVTPSDIMEHLFCPRFTYFIFSAGVPQYEKRRYKVQKGREIHDIRQSQNTHYLWKKIGTIERESSVYLSSEKLRLRGIIDEILTLEDGTMAPMDFKFAEYKKSIYRTHKFQIVCYGMLIRENYNKTVNRGFILYTRSNEFKEIPIIPKDEKELQKIIDEMMQIIDDGYFPDKCKITAKCNDCTYKNICCH